MPRTARLRRETAETKIDLAVDLDGSGTSEIRTGVGFFDHMLTLLSKHSLIDLTVAADGRSAVDAHHTVEDVGICFGKALAQALGDKAGIRRYGDATVPMDETLVTAAVDLQRPAVLRVESRRAARNCSALQHELGRRVLAGRVVGGRLQSARRRATTAVTRTTSSRRFSKRRRGRCGKPSKPTRARAACRRRRACCKNRVPSSRVPGSEFGNRSTRNLERGILEQIEEQKS